MYDKDNKKIVFYSLINGVGNSTMAYQLARLLRLPLYQEQKNDLVYFLKSILNSSRYTVKQLDELYSENYAHGGVYDLKTANKKIFTLASDIVVLTNNSYIDVLKTIASLEKIQALIHDKTKPIHVVFNRLQNGNVGREKKYTRQSKNMILTNIKDMNIKFSYLRTNLIYYREIKDGRFFMDSFFKKDDELLDYYPEIKEMEHTDHLEMFYDYQYEDMPYDFRLFENYYQRLYDDRVESALEYNQTLKIGTKPRNSNPEGINKEIAELNFDRKNISNSRASIRDMYSFLYKMGIYSKEMYECYECQKNSTCWKRTIRETRDTKKLSGEQSKCRELRTRIEDG